jgi:hypothetical protein
VCNKIQRLPVVKLVTTLEFQSWMQNTAQLLIRLCELSQLMFSDSQCCGSGAFLTPGSGMVKKSGPGSGIRIRDEQPGSYFRELRNHFLGLIFNVDLGSGMKKIRIRDPV